MSITQHDSKSIALSIVIVLSASLIALGQVILSTDREDGDRQWADRQGRP